jgi:hypothetical protein
VWGFTNGLGPLVSGALLGAGVFGLPLVIGSLMYFCGGLAFGIGFTRLLGRRTRVDAHAVAAPGGGDAAP